MGKALTEIESRNPEMKNSNGQMIRNHRDKEESKSQDKVNLYFREYFFLLF